MRCLKFLVGVILFLSCVCSWAREVTDTIESANKDKVYITYEIRENNGHFDIYFLNSRKLLGPTYKNKYQRLDEIAVLFFDRIGNYNDGLKFDGINVEPFMISKELNYKKSKDGYFLMHDKPVLSFGLESGDSTEISIPIFLAHYEGKLSYKVFSRCENLVIKLSKKKSLKEHVVTNQQSMTQTTVLNNITEETDNDEILTEFLISKIAVLLAEQDEFPFSENLSQYIEELQKIQMRNISNQSMSVKIDGILEDCKQKEQELKAIAKAEEEAIEQAESLRIAKEKARQDSIAAAAQHQAENDSKRNLWLIIGGAILAVLGFIGNQVLQHFRNAKNQRNIMAMQEDMRKRAENEAKRRARNMANSQINRVEGDTKRQAKDTIKTGIGKISKKGNKRISI